MFIVRLGPGRPPWTARMTSSGGLGRAYFEGSVQDDKANFGRLGPSNDIIELVVTETFQVMQAGRSAMRYRNPDVFRLRSCRLFLSLLRCCLFCHGQAP